MQDQAQHAITELKRDLSKNIELKDEAAAHAQDAKKHMQKLSERTAQVNRVHSHSHSVLLTMLFMLGIG